MSGSSKFLIIAEYASETERKRIDYMLEKWSNTLDIQKPKGIAAIVSGDKINAMLEDLYSRIPDKQVNVQRLSDSTIEVEETTREYLIELEGSKETVEKLFGFIMAKQRAVLGHDSNLEKKYTIRTKKGSGDVFVRILNKNNRTTVKLFIKGYGDAPDFILERIKEELKFFEEVNKYGNNE